MKAETSILNLVRQEGLSVTLSRREVIRAVCMMGRPFTIEHLRQHCPHLGRATIFRNVRLLVEMGALCRVSGADGRALYSLRGTQEHHHHTLCVDCDSIGDFHSEELERALARAAAGLSKRPMGHVLYLYVRCGECRGAQGVDDV